ncbi:DUF305 domain-containing protein [Nonomuraea sp. NPDC049725]|uniref:DUF305 domain-containing protein n=1 Tax=Nonomuraea sp. NPDC049725 TaxID=3154508 RepID=UPI00342FDD13
MRYVLAALGLLLAVACGPGEAAAPPVNADDVMFVQMMVQHHRQGIEIAKVGADRATTPELKTLTEAIATTQQSEVEMMLRWLHAWGQPLTPPDGAHDHHGGLPETEQKKIDALRRAKDPEPELMALLIAHQGDAARMAGTEVLDGANPEVMRWAAQVQASRREQIEQLRKLLER